MCQGGLRRGRLLKSDEILQKTIKIAAGAKKPLTYPLGCANRKEFLRNSLLFAHPQIARNSLGIPCYLHAADFIDFLLFSAEKVLCVLKAHTEKMPLYRTSARSAAPRRGRRKFHEV